MANLIRSITARPTLMLRLLVVVFGLILFPAYSIASELEEDIKLENWMITPFESDFEEFELQMENWMITPFESDFVEFELQMENWMITPFETEFVEFDISMESWMISTWI